jgi:putative addiction module component (TIGR02574 family)
MIRVAQREAELQMSDRCDQLKAQISALSSAERADLAFFLIRSLDDAGSELADDAWEAELDRRAAELVADPSCGVALNDAVQQLSERRS